MKKTITLLILMFNSYSFASSDLNYQLQQFCATPTLNTSYRTQVGEVTAIGFHRNGNMKVSQNSNNDKLITALMAIAQQVNIGKECMEFLDITQLIKSKEERELFARIYFDFDRQSLTQESKQILDNIAVKMIRHPYMIRLEGHTDAIGTKGYNYQLGLRRANSTADYLIDKGIADTQLVISSEGKTKPISSNKTAEGRKD
ncbi:OmpA family protein, partial [Photobacterium sanctipauli]